MKMGKEMFEVKGGLLYYPKKKAHTVLKKYVLLIFYLLRVRRHYINNKSTN